MITAQINGIRIAYEDTGGPGHTVLLVMGTGSPARVWEVHQVPALKAAGFRVVSMNNRGIPPSDECPHGFTMDDMVNDVVGLIEHLGCDNVSLVGTSLGARIVVEAALARPDLLSRVIALAAHARLEPLQQAMTRGEIELAEQACPPPADYRAAVMALQYLSPATLRDEGLAQDWLDMFAFDDGRISAGHKAQLQISQSLGDRRPAYRNISIPLLVVGFSDDAAIPPRLSREVAEVVPGAEYVEIADAGHFGYLEKPAEVNRLIINYLRRSFAATGAIEVPEDIRVRHV
ncbi:bromoperoxidase protein (plasmid) [Rhizobium etli 8C-3]|uniref:Bromoperoxidase protein n=1 Tax=Rhizobium etli 8C-3 TaxID=538025 RepID=A0A1L5P9T1_RHIET|nr:alpha/beta hydrolase [Rhizobium etli]APO76921.1 bromoperoxidase protein [Rhizobium etli 8C-3]